MQTNGKFAGPPNGRVQVSKFSYERTFFPLQKGPPTQTHWDTRAVPMNYNQFININVAAKGGKLGLAHKPDLVLSRVEPPSSAGWEKR